MRPLTTAPVLDGWAVVERLLTDLAALKDRLWLVIDDAHLLGSGEVLPQLELLVLRAPQELRFVVATRRDLRLGLHRLRLEGELTEIRAADLRFSLAEARALFGAAGVELPADALGRLHRRTEGWAAGLRLAALSLDGHPDPERFAEEFSGSERTVADYLLAEVLDRQSAEVRRLLLRTSLLERVNGDLADLLTGASGGERILQDLERAGAFVASLDAARSWFRYHRLFADLLQLELRRTEPDGRGARGELAQRTQCGVDEQRVQGCCLIGELFAVHRRIRCGGHLLSPSNKRPYTSDFSPALIARRNDLTLDDLCHRALRQFVHDPYLARVLVRGHLSLDMGRTRCNRRG